MATSNSVKIGGLGSAGLNRLRPRQDGRRFPNDTFERIFLKENVIILIKISLKFVPNDPINNIPTLVQIMACRRPSDKPLSEPMMVSEVLVHPRLFHWKYQNVNHSNVVQKLHI